MVLLVEYRVDSKCQNRPVFCWGTAMGKILTSHHANRLKLKLQSRPRPTQQLGWLGGGGFEAMVLQGTITWKTTWGKKEDHLRKCQAGGVEWKMFPFFGKFNIANCWKNDKNDFQTLARVKKTFTVTNEETFAGRGERNFKWERSAGSHDLGRERQIMMGMGRWWAYETIDPHAKIRWLDESQCFVTQLGHLGKRFGGPKPAWHQKSLCRLDSFRGNSPPKLLGFNLVKYVFLHEKIAWFVGCQMFFWSELSQRSEHGTWKTLDLDTW